MCLVKKPKVAQAATEKEAAILRNPYLDGLDPIIRARSGGVKSLTIRRGQTAAPTLPARPTAPIPSPISGGSGDGSKPGQGNMSDKDFASATFLSKMGGPLGLYAKHSLSKAQK